jgi:hypothetical protein
LTNSEIEAFEFWFMSKHNAERLGENQLAMRIDVDGQSIPTFVAVFDGFWSVYAPIRMLDRKAKKDLYEIMDEHANHSALGLIVVGDMLCIVNCFYSFNAADAEEIVLDIAANAAELMA